MENRITFVSAFLHIYSTPYDHRNNEWRITKFKELASTGIPICLFISPEFISCMREICETYSNVVVKRVLSITDTRFWKLWSNLPLPKHRKPEKDTLEYLCLMNSKIEFVEEVMWSNRFFTDYFAWVDFNITHVFQSVEKSLKRLTYIYQHINQQKILAIPGCWQRGECQTDSIVWRFCGGFFVGHSTRLLPFFEKAWEQAQLCMPTWEVNLWAKCETELPFQIDWFQADHNDSMTQLPAKHYSDCLSTCYSVAVKCPYLKHFHPSSISHGRVQGRDLINIRYVNYHLLPNGAYHYPSGEGVIKNINMISVVNEKMEPEGFSIVKEGGLGIVEQSQSFSKGIEDVRLFSGKNGELRFIGTTVGYHSQQQNRMIVGDYDVVVKGNTAIAEFKEGCVIESPFSSFCEKNWIPLEDEHYIYSWHPYRIVKRVGQEFEMVSRELEPAFLWEKIRGSSVFHRMGDREGGGSLGVVHFSENESPRHYYHMLVVLDEQRIPCRYSRVFHFFDEVGIEFCIGFCVLREKYYFWVSREDRDPRLFVLTKGEIENLFRI